MSAFTPRAPVIAAATYVLPIASSTILGGVKVGTGLAIDGSGILSVTAGGGTPAHNDLTGLQGGIVDEYYHATAASYAAINRMSWNTEDGTVDIAMGFDAVVQQVGLESYFRVINQTGAALSNGSVVRAVGTLGISGQLLVNTAIANNTHLSREVLGILTMDIANGASGYVTEFGLVRGINTTGTPVGEVWADGDVLYVSPTTAGALTKVLPTAPNQKIVVAMVINTHTNGSLLVRPSHGNWLGDLHNVSSVAPSAGQFLGWNATTSVWEPKTVGHNTTSGLQGGAVDQYYHLTSAQHTIATQAASTSLSGYLSSTDWNTFNSKQPAGSYEVTSAKGAANGYCPLGADSKIASTYIPSLAITEYLGNFADTTAALANAGVQASQRGDWFTVSTSGGQSYIVISDLPTLIGHISKLSTPTDAVLSVNGYTGTVVLVKADVGLGSVENTALSTWTGSANITTLGTIGSLVATTATINGGTITGITDITVADGGTGRSTGTTAYSLIATGTTATGAQQTLANGLTTQVLVGGGVSALPVWTTATGSGAPVRATSPTLTTPVLSGLITNGLGTQGYAATLGEDPEDAARFADLGTAVYADLITMVRTSAPRIITTISAVIQDNNTWVIINYAGTCTLTLPTASLYLGMVLTIKTITANTVVSASSNVVPLIDGAAGTAILPATIGKWARLVSNGTNWQIMEAA